jgi:hypothetical protein
MQNAFVCVLCELNGNNYFVHMFKIKQFEMCQVFLAHRVFADGHR